MKGSAYFQFNLFLVALVIGTWIQRPDPRPLINLRLKTPDWEDLGGKRPQNLILLTKLSNSDQ